MHVAHAMQRPNPDHRPTEDDGYHDEGYPHDAFKLRASESIGYLSKWLPELREVSMSWYDVEAGFLSMFSMV